MKKSKIITIMVLIVLSICNYSIPIIAVTLSNAEIITEDSDQLSIDGLSYLDELKQEEPAKIETNENLDSEIDKQPDLLYESVQQTWGDIKWEFDEQTGILLLSGDGTLGTFETSPWNRSDDLRVNFIGINKIVLSGDIKAPMDSTSLFSSAKGELMSSLLEIDGLEKLDTSDVNNFSKMFYGLDGLNTLNLTGFNTLNADNMSGMFSNMTNLTHLDLSSFSMMNVSSVTGMFYNTPKLNSLILGSDFQFKSVDASLTDIVSTDSCSGYWEHKETRFNMGNSVDFMTKYDGRLPGAYIWSEKKLSWGNVPWSFDEESGILQFTGGGVLGSFDSSPWNRNDNSKIDSQSITKIEFTKPTESPVDATRLFSSDRESNYLVGLKKIEGLDLLNTSKTTNFSQIFKGLSSITNLDLSNFDTTRAKEVNDGSRTRDDNYIMYSGFEGLDSLEKLILGERFQFFSINAGLPNTSDDWVNTETGYNMGDSSELMVNYDGNKPGVYIKTSRETLQWGDVFYTFDEGSGVLTFTSSGTLGVFDDSPWNKEIIEGPSIKKIVFKENVVAPSYSTKLFSGKRDEQSLSNLESFEGLDNLDTSNSTDMSFMFYGMRSVEELDLSNFKTDKVNNMAFMFWNVNSVKKLNLESFNTSHVSTMWSMFYGMNSIKELNLSGFNTSRVNEMGTMFEGMESLEKLDISQFDMTKVTGVDNMFARSTQLKQLKLGEKFQFVSTNANLSTITQNNIYSGNWRNVELDKIVGTSDDFMKMENIEAGTYVWDRDEKQALFNIEEVPDKYEFKLLDGSHQSDKFYSPTDYNGQSISVSDKRMIKTRWKLTVSASPFVDQEDSTNELENVKFRMNLKQAPSTVNSLDISVPQEIILDKEPETVIDAPAVEGEYSEDVFVTVDVNSMGLMVPNFSQNQVNKTYKGDLTWMVNLTP